MDLKKINLKDVKFQEISSIEWYNNLNYTTTNNADGAPTNGLWIN